MREALFDRLDLSEVTLFCQDWGGLIGRRLVADAPDGFARVVAANTGLSTADRPPNKAFLSWQRYSRESPDLPVGRIISSLDRDGSGSRDGCLRGGCGGESAGQG